MASDINETFVFTLIYELYTKCQRNERYNYREMNEFICKKSQEMIASIFLHQTKARAIKSSFGRMPLKAKNIKLIVNECAHEVWIIGEIIKRDIRLAASIPHFVTLVNDIMRLFTFISIFYIKNSFIDNQMLDEFVDSVTKLDFRSFITFVDVAGREMNSLDDLDTIFDTLTQELDGYEKANGTKTEHIITDRLACKTLVIVNNRNSNIF